MPDTRIQRPLPALLGEFDASPFVGDVFNRTDNGVTTASSIPSTAGRYWDVIAFLNGYGSRPGQSMDDIAAKTWGGTHAIKFGIDHNDKFFVETQEDFTLNLEPYDHSNLGFDPVDTRATQETRSGVTYYRVTAPGPWKRGVFQMLSGFKVTRHAPQGDVVELVVWELPRVQSLPVFLRTRGSMNDADDVWAEKTLEDFDSQADARWLIEPNGTITVNYFENQGFAFDVIGTQLWQRLGGDGLETSINAVGGRKNLTTRHPARCVLLSHKGYVELRREIHMRDTRQVMTDGSIVSSGLPVLRGWRLTLRIDGPAHGAAQNGELHLRRWWSHSRRTLTLYPSFGDSDRPTHERFGCGGIDTRRSVRYLEPAPNERYTLFHSAGAEDPEVIHHKRQGGRLLVRLHPTDDQNRRESYEHSKDIHQDVDLVLLDDPSR